jgi:hypothetical protein
MSRLVDHATPLRRSAVSVAGAPHLSFSVGMRDHGIGATTYGRLALLLMFAAVAIVIAVWGSPVPSAAAAAIFTTACGSGTAPRSPTEGAS